MNTYSGVVTKVASNDWNGTLLHSFQIQEAPNVWFRTGEKESGLTAGEAISFGFDGKKVDPKDIVRIDASEIAKTETASVLKSAPKRSGASRNDYWTEKQEFERRMQPVWDWGRARSDAARLVQTALVTGALEFPKSANNAKRMGLLTAFLHEVTQELINKEQDLKDE